MSLQPLREQLRARRRRLGLGHQIRVARTLAAQLASMDLYRRSQHLACYLASDGELSCLPLIKRAWQQGKKCYLPVLSGENSGLSLKFAQYAPGTPLKPNRFGILEPLAARLYAATDLDLVLVPLVGFDPLGNRLGMGGGYYDRSFAFRKHQASPILLGIAHRCQQVRSIQVRSWDIPMDDVLAF